MILPDIDVYLCTRCRRWSMFPSDWNMWAGHPAKTCLHCGGRLAGMFHVHYGDDPDASCDICGATWRNVTDRGATLRE